MVAFKLVHTNHLDVVLVADGYRTVVTKNEFFALAFEKCRIQPLLTGAIAGVGVYVCLLVLAALPG